MVAIVECRSSLHLGAAIISLADLLIRRPVSFNLLLARTASNLLSIQVDCNCFDLPLPTRLWHQLYLCHGRLFLLKPESIRFGHFEGLLDLGLFVQSS